MKKILARMWQIYKPFRSKIIVIWAFTLVIQGLSSLAPLLFGKTLDWVLAHRPIWMVAILAGFACFVELLGRAVLPTISDMTVVADVEHAVSTHTAIMSLRKLASLSIGQHVNNHSGVKHSVVMRGESSLDGLLYLFIYEIVPLMMQCLFTAILLLWVNWFVGTLAILAGAIHIAWSHYHNKLIRDDVKKLHDLQHSDQKFYSEVLYGMPMLLLHGQEDRMIDKYVELRAKEDEMSKRVWIGHSRRSVPRSTLLIMVRYALVPLVAYDIYHGLLPAGCLVIFLGATANLFSQIGSFAKIQRRLIEFKSRINKYFELLDLPSDVPEPAEPVLVEEIEGKIEFRNVSFTYPRRQTEEGAEVIFEEWEQRGDAALHDINLIIEPGQTVVVVGESGCGKSTLTSLIARPADPQKGSVLIDDIDLKRFSTSALKHVLRAQIGFVEQSVQLFDDTLKNNVLFGLNGRAATFPTEELETIAKMSRIDTFIHRLEKGFATWVGEGGVKLSGGQCQRVGIARAMAKSPKILIFDEATSNLDTRNERLIQAAINEVAQGRTTIIVTHRLSMIRNADLVVVMDQGRIVAKGTHDTLVVECEIYRNLVTGQVEVL